MSVLEYKDYRKSLSALRRRGGRFQKAAEKAIVYQNDLEDEYLRKKLHVTNHGETRIDKAIKYDIGGNGCRLVTVQNDGHIFLCFAGTHDDVDKWLDKNRGLTIRVDKNKRAVLSFESRDYTNPDERLQRDMGYTDKLLLSLLPQQQQDAILRGVSWSVAKAIAETPVYINDDEIEQLVDRVEDTTQRTAVFDVLMLLREENIDGASNRIRAFTGELCKLGDQEQSLPSLEDSEYFQNVDVSSEHYQKLIENFALNADYKDWMLFMHPAQQRFVDADYAGPAKVTGVSGSGKTAVVVRRAIALTERYPDQQVLVLTLNRSLAVLIEELVNTAALEEVRDRIEVLPFFVLCQRFLYQFEPDNTRLYDDVTWKSREHIDAIWREYYRCELHNYDARVLQKVHDSLISRGIDAESYIREEFDWIRSATAPGNRDAYLSMERTGRTYPLDANFRQDLLRGLETWERKMTFVGVTDYLGIANALYRHIDKMEPRYRCVLVDESQDFGTIDFQLIRRLVPEDSNDVFLCGDAAQKVSSKHHSLSDASLSVAGSRSHKLVLNYRNSRQILELAHGMLMDNLSNEMLQIHDFEILDPEYANFGGPTPLFLSAESFGDELAAAVTYAKSETEENSAAKICIAICGFSEHELASFAQNQRLPLLNGETDLKGGQIIVSDLENTKGFEFQCIIIVNCADGVVPNPRAPEEEAFRDLSRLYVAMTRARHQLVLSCCGAPSPFLEGQLKRLGQYLWEEYIGQDQDLAPIEPPKRLEQLRHDTPPRDILSMTGEEYLYQEDAIGCPALLVEKLRKLVTGNSRIVQGIPAEWRSISAALKDTRSKPRCRQLFGPEGYRLFRERFGN